MLLNWECTRIFAGTCKHWIYFNPVNDHVHWITYETNYYYVISFVWIIHRHSAAVPLFGL